ncbi:MAG: cytochrome bc complex cytochrome b subunit [Elusimicrobia bacterium]|nr:cytochrome bc complex cytochrome b subunit [Elusimicrobiota bacterium]
MKDLVLSWLDERYKLSSFLEWARHKTVPVHRWTIFYYTGGVCLFLFLVQIATGILLLMYYRVGAESSYESVRFITSQVEFGWLMRSVHSWAANLLIFFVLAHMFSIFVMRSYRSPRELSWVTGCFLLGLMMAFGFSGYLLPWNELAYFATKVGTDIVGQLPVAGGWLLKLVRGGEEVTGATLSRFFGLHVAILPAAATCLIGVHLLFVQVQGMSHGEDAKAHMPFFPNFVLRDLALWLVALNVICVLAVFFPWELGLKADALKSAPAGIKPEWYFLSQYQLLKVMPARILLVPGELWGIFLFGAAGGAVLLLPFWDSLIRARGKERWLDVLGWGALAATAALTVWGHLS